MKITKLAITIGTVLCCSGMTRAAAPQPVGTAELTVTWQTATGPQSETATIDYTGNSPLDAAPLEPGSNINFVGVQDGLAKRLLVPGALEADETMLYNGFFKPAGNTTDWFENIEAGSSVTFEIQGIDFDQPAEIQTDTYFWHQRWDPDQSDFLAYINLDNYELQVGGTRDMTDFFTTIPPLMTDSPTNYTVGSLAGAFAPEFFGQGTSTLGWSITVPYDLLDHQENVGQAIPDGLPAPHGFLEPFHFHFEMAVAPVPEPATGLFLIGGAVLLGRRRRSR